MTPGIEFQTYYEESLPLGRLGTVSGGNLLAGPFPCKCARCPGFRPCQGAKRGVKRGGRERDITRLFTGQRHGGIWRCRDVTIPSVPLCHLTVGAIRRPILLPDLSRSSLPQSSGKRDCLQQVMRIETSEIGAAFN
ncbi:hypothetical protein Bbelb_439310 [Branchiostoma belcheri]|nr:hypothetical protein Bbelb_439310 [Branchiostoma belcheri]